MLTDPDKLAEFEAENEVDFSYSRRGPRPLPRQRLPASAARSRSSCAPSRSTIKSVDELGLPPVVTELAEEERGIILLTGTTGSGKSTTLAAMIDHMNRTMHKHIVTIEDPIEFLHRDRSSIINQREVGQDTASFKRALRRVLRQDPDVILVGEMRDEETVHTALSRGRDRPPRALHAAHGRRAGDGQPHHRLLPAPPAAAGARDDRRHAEGHRLPAPRPDRRRQRPRRVLRDPGHDRPRARHDPRPEADRAAARGRSPRAATTGCRRSTSTCSAPAGRPDHDRGGDARRHLAARLQADGRRPDGRARTGAGESRRRRSGSRRLATVGARAAERPAPRPRPPPAPPRRLRRRPLRRAPRARFSPPAA